MSTSLGVIRLDQPCQLPWDQMRGDDRTRYCTQCNLNVHNLSAMSEAEATAFLAMRDRRVCVSYQRREDGTAMFDDGSAQVAAPRPQLLTYETPTRRRRWVAAAAVMGAVATAGATAAYRARPTPLPVPPVLKKVPAVNVPQVAGGVCPLPIRPFDPLSPSANLKCGPVRAKQLRDQLQHDPIGKALVAALPAGLEVVDVHYSVYPAGVKEAYGQVYVLGTPGEAATSAPAVTAVVWLLPKGTKLDAKLKPVNPSFPSASLHHAAALAKHEVFIESGDEELEKVVRQALIDGEAAAAGG